MSNSLGGRRQPAIAYGIDIGVYRHGRRGKVLQSTTFAWARADEAVLLTFDRAVESPAFRFSGQPSTGNDIRGLVEAIRHDFNTDCQLAIGIEAPMWQPAPNAVPSGSFDLFESRFPQEQGFGWYLQSGAAALAKAITTGRLLFSLIRAELRNETCTTRLQDPPDSAKVILFEGFVVDRWKLPSHVGFESDQHAWDALTTAVAFHCSAEWREDCPRPSSLIHRAGTHSAPVISHWKTVLDNCDLSSSDCEADCAVLGFDSTDARLIETCSRAGATANQP